MVHKILPKDKSLSITAPPSFWYLQGFNPITNFKPLLDYMVYMTYDLHGQWDYNNKWATPGCPKGNCLRSHVNNTKTMTAMSMITKAGMPTNKVIMGVASYSHSFKMAQAGCTGPMCLYLGPVSAAAPGRCTETPGYITLAEI
jgi:GH18 family chitinase